MPGKANNRGGFAFFGFFFAPFAIPFFVLLPAQSNAPGAGKQGVLGLEPAGFYP
jgi:hypothetical protein